MSSWRLSLWPLGDAKVGWTSAGMRLSGALRFDFTHKHLIFRWRFRTGHGLAKQFLDGFEQGHLFGRTKG